MHFILDIGIRRLSVTLTKMLCDVMKKAKSKVQDWYIKNITKQKPRYSLSICYIYIIYILYIYDIYIISLSICYIYIYMGRIFIHLLSLLVHVFNGSIFKDHKSCRLGWLSIYVNTPLSISFQAGPYSFRETKKWQRLYKIYVIKVRTGC